MAGISHWGAYVPYWRLQRAAIGAALKTNAGSGTRAVASYDENTTSLAVEAARAALAAGHRHPDVLTFSTTAPAYLDKTNATTIHAALGLASTVGAYDFLGGIRSSVGATLAAHRAVAAGSTTLVTTADMRSGLPGGADERDGGDGAAAFLFSEDAVAEVVADAHVSQEFLDRWRIPGTPSSSQWEERFGEHAYIPLADAAVTDSLKAAGLAAGELDHVVVAGSHGRAARRVAASIGAKTGASGIDLLSSIGNTGAAAWALGLCDVLERAEPNQTILLVSLADGADAVVLRTTSRLPAVQHLRAELALPSVQAQVAAGRTDLDYNAFLTWRGMLRREAPRRPDPSAPAAPPALRTQGWKFGFTASRCNACGTRHLPPGRVCVSCSATDDMTPERLSETRGTVVTFTVDRLAYSLSPPVVAAVIDFDGGGRFPCEITEIEPADVHIGLRVEMTFRNLFTAEGVHNYFWKAKPVRQLSDNERSS